LTSITDFFAMAQAKLNRTALHLNEQGRIGNFFLKLVRRKAASGSVVLTVLIGPFRANDVPRGRYRMGDFGGVRSLI
jgi:hypothetical protein